MRMLGKHRNGGKENKRKKEYHFQKQKDTEKKRSLIDHEDREQGQKTASRKARPFEFLTIIARTKGQHNEKRRVVE